MARLKLGIGGGDEKKPSGNGSASTTVASTGKPLNAGGITGTPEQQDIWEYMREMPDHLVVNAVAGSGKCLGRGTPVMLSDGTISSVEDVKVGQSLMGPDSLPRMVLSTSTGFGPLYKVTPTKGDSWVCNDVHVMTVQGTHPRKGQVRDIPLDILLAERPDRPDQVWKLFRVPLDFAPQDVPIDPYLLGTWLGDGTYTYPQWTFGTEKEVILGYLICIADRYGCVCKYTWEDDNNSYNVRFSVMDRGEKRVPHVFRDTLFSIAKSPQDSRWIHPSYLHNSRGVRQALLAGLLDTDGSYDNGVFDFVTAYPQLRDGMLFLCRSLGLSAYAVPKSVQLEGWEEPRTYYRICISGGFEELPLLRHQVSSRRQRKSVLRTGWRAEPIGEGEYFGFTLSGDGRFLLGDFTVTHNTYTSVEGSKRLQWLQRERGGRRKDIQYMAFSKPVQEEMHAKAGEWVKAKTFHSAGLAAVQARFGQGRRLEVDFSRDRTWKVMERTPGMPKDKAIRAGTKQLVSLAKEYGAVEREELTGIISRHGLAFGEGARGEGAEEVEEAVLYWTPRVLERSLEVAKGEAISGGDMVWLPYAHELPIPRAELLIVDEAQDLNRVQQWFAARAGERVLVVGDRHQAIFGWRGSDSKSIDTLVDLLGGAVEKRLSFTRRCPVKVVELAQRVVPYIRAWEGAEEGKVGEVQERRLAEKARPRDMVLCRVNAPLIEAAYGFIEQGKPAFIRGRDIKEGIERLLREAEEQASIASILGKGDGTASMRGVLLAASMVTEREVERLIDLPEGRGETRAARAKDRLRCLHAAARGCQGVGQLREKLTALFEQGERGTMFSSVHKAKGLEADRVWVLKPELMPFPKAKEGWELEQEWNLWYVAVTRVRKELWWVRGEGKQKERWEER